MLKNQGQEIKFGYTLIYVFDVESTMDLYNKAFNIKTAFLHESYSHAIANGAIAITVFMNYLFMVLVYQIGA